MELKGKLGGKVAFSSGRLQVAFNSWVGDCVRGGDGEEMFHPRAEEVGTLRHERELTGLAETNQEPIGVLGHTAGREEVGVSVEDQAEPLISSHLWSWVSPHLTKDAISAVQRPSSVL